MTKVLLKNAFVARLHPASLERCDLRIGEGKIIERAANLTAHGDEEVIELAGKLVLPGLVCAHTHLYSGLARGMPAPPQTPQNFHEILQYIWWRLDRALDEETIYWSAIAAGLDALRAGTTTLIDHHASPGFITNSLSIVKQAMNELGLRTVLCYEVTDRGGENERDAGIAENRQALESQGGLTRALVGAHAAFTLSARSLAMLAELAEQFNCGVHIHVAEDRLDEADARNNHHSTLIARLHEAGLLRNGSLLAHCTHLDEEALALAVKSGCWLLHNPRSNMNNSVGYANVSKFGPQAALGTDGIGADMFEEAKFAFYKSHDARRPLSAEQVLNMLAGGQQLAGNLFNENLTELTAGTAADLTVVDYQSPTPLSSENFAWHFIFGMTSAQAESVMVAGRFLMRERRCLTIDAADAAQRAQAAARKLWQKMAKI